MGWEVRSIRPENGRVSVRDKENESEKDSRLVAKSMSGKTLCGQTMVS